jgi:hypothetical protein
VLQHLCQVVQVGQQRLQWLRLGLLPLPLPQFVLLQYWIWALAQG